MNVQNTEARNVFRERSEQGVSAVPGSLAAEPAREGGADRREEDDECYALLQAKT